MNWFLHHVTEKMYLHYSTARELACWITHSFIYQYFGINSKLINDD